MIQRSLLVVFAAVLLPAGSAYGASYFLPGQEEAVTGLIAPHGSENMVLDGWSLDGLFPGPPCEVRLSFVAADGGDKTTLTLLPSAEAGGNMTFKWEPLRPAGLGDAAEALVKGNDPGGFFDERCTIMTDPEDGTDVIGGPAVASAEQGESETAGSEVEAAEEAMDEATAAEGDADPVPIVVPVALGVIVLVALVAILFMKRKKKPAPKPPAPPAG